MKIYDYEPYRKKLKDCKIKQEQLIKSGVINRSNASSLKQNKAVNIETLEKLCTYFNCQFDELIRHIQEEEI